MDYDFRDVTDVVGVKNVKIIRNHDLVSEIGRDRARFCAHFNKTFAGDENKVTRRMRGGLFPISHAIGQIFRDFRDSNQSAALLGKAECF